ncbi:MAG: tRNA preQ1(34) S-adenosylmethionine ribosyltransferase-isomerase QueA [Lentisphaerae bacterium RIFOXYA12_FULL_48_11]|nr:MAG: tRNA preQ1(34) S-adenosylmethionine ribosyltransferase-isomerase QueA [Lentisphaerae bacterium RIFOXYA12_FULL_48_11]
MRTADFDFDLPKELIAQQPLPDRSSARMMVVHRDGGQLEHRHVNDLPEYLRAGDLLVLNDTKVIPARVFGRRGDTGGRVELLLVERLDKQEESSAKILETWDVFYRASGRPRVGMKLSFAGDKLDAEVLSVGKMGRVVLRFSCGKPVLEILEEEGFAPVPPYIRRTEQHTAVTDMDKKCYQTIYARNPGAVAAPTAGLHFTPDLLGKLQGQGVHKTTVTLHVGPGTFKPVKSETVEEHVMEPERFEISAETAAAVNLAHARKDRIVAVGSTTVRTLESSAVEDGLVKEGGGRTSLFIYPPYSFKIIDVMMTNFHLPKSSLLMMVSALAGRDLIVKAYHEAVQSGYRFYSYGDCMLII